MHWTEKSCRKTWPVLALLAVSCGDTGESSVARERQGSPWFVESAMASGLNFVHQSGHTERHYMPEIMGGGAALFDMDGDGDLDAYLVQSGKISRLDDYMEQAGNLQGMSSAENRLFLNDGKGQFSDVTEGSGAGDMGYGNGVACGDVDGDGDTDLYVTNTGPNVLLINQGAGIFVDGTQRAGVGDAAWGTSATFFDADGDGLLDLFVTNYLDWTTGSEMECSHKTSGADYCSPKNYKSPARDVFYRNLGGGRFEDQSAKSGIAAEPGNGLGVACADFNGDGHADIFVANDGMADHLWIGDGQGAFENKAYLWGCATDSNGLKKAGMGVALADIDDDLDVDILVCNLSGESDSMYLNNGGHFTDGTAMGGLAAVSKAFTRFGMGLVDFDQDGYLDLYQANGRVARANESRPGDPYAEENLVLRGNAKGRFEEVFPRGGTSVAHSATSRAAAFGDVNGDGAVDVLVVNRDSAAHLFVNQAAGDSHWIGMRVLEANGSPALGATVHAQVGQRKQRRDVRAGYSYQASNDPTVHLGLGTENEVTGVSVRWTDGGEQSFGSLKAGQVHELRRK
jgi:hypothetical protein